MTATAHITREAFHALPFAEDVDTNAFELEQLGGYRSKSGTHCIHVPMVSPANAFIGWCVYPVEFTNPLDTTNLSRSKAARQGLGALYAGTVHRIVSALDIVHEFTDGDLRTHESAWRQALQTTVNRTEPLETDESDANHLYWQHELDVFNRVFAALNTSTVTGRNVLQGAEWDTPPAPLQQVHHEPVYKHLKSGGFYRLLGIMHVMPLTRIRDMATVTVYPDSSGVVVASEGLITNTDPIYGFHGQLPVAVYTLQVAEEWHQPGLMAFYASLKDGSVWIRPASEFFDGRFEQGYRHD